MSQELLFLGAVFLHTRCCCRFSQAAGNFCKEFGGFSDGEHSAAIPHLESPFDLISSSPALLELTLFIPPLPRDNSIRPFRSLRIPDCMDD